MKKQQKIDLMVEEIMRGEMVPIIFDPYKNETDCMILWDKFSLGHATELYSYSNSNDWSATRYDKDEEGNSLDSHTAAESIDRRRAMCECMVGSSLKSIKIGDK